ncbi:MAG: FAD-dependent oxidoreductase [Anaerolineaceae bacterium]
MNQEYESIVVGAGVAGLTCAAYLAKNGVKTLLVEKQNKTGGLVNTFWRDGFAFDAGARAFENSGILFPMLKGLGIEIEFIKNSVSIGIGNRWVKLHSRASLEDYADMLSKTFQDNASDIFLIKKEIQKIMSYLDVIYGIDNPLFLEDMHDFEYMKNTLLPWLIKYQRNIHHIRRLQEPVYQYLEQFTSNQALIDMIAQHFFQNTPAFFALSYFSLYLDYNYPVGGTGVLTKKLTDYYLDADGNLLLEKAVIGLDIDKRELELSDGQRFGYNQLVWAADQKTLYQVIRGPVSRKIEERRALTSNSLGADSIFTLFLAVDMDRDVLLERMGAHAFYTPKTQGLSSLPPWKKLQLAGRESLYSWVESFLQITTYELSCPAVRDDTLAPPGQTGLIISTLMDYQLVKIFAEAGEYENFKKFCTEKIIAILDSALFTGLQEKLLFSIPSTPLTIEKNAGTHQGAITGWAFANPEMPSESRFDKIIKSVKTPIQNLHQCGQWTFSPSGVPTCVLTGKLAADAVLKNLRR